MLKAVFQPRKIAKASVQSPLGVKGSLSSTERPVPMQTTVKTLKTPKHPLVAAIASADQVPASVRVRDGECVEVFLNSSL